MKRTDSIQIGDVVIDFNRSYIMRKGKITYLRGTSLNLLRYFIENANALLTRDALLVHVWGYCGSNITRTVDMHVSKLRKAIEPDPRHPQHILTVQGQGYKFIGTDNYVQKSLSA
ncbi:MAG: response regulator transcription factor [Acidobacteria bacterium]|nr:response regulator transcription factor [Acidobacteriota bacterium]MCB9398189.1 response regulator transcription factor [Acidobacteriota bacterium]